MKYFIINPIIGVGLFAVGYFVSQRKKKPTVKYIGNLRIDNSEKDEPSKIFIEFDVDPNNLNDCDYVNLKVVKENYVKSK